MLPYESTPRATLAIGAPFYFFSVLRKKMISRESQLSFRNATKATVMESITWIPAAQYLRVSTEDQQYSIANQESVIADYARNRGFEVISTYSDPGRSGISLKSRRGLRQLLSDVIGGKARFRTILVHDVSRWGRFQDIDESAHYEFLCRSAGIPVHYCAEQFINDGSVASSILKTLKRTMAAEYSRELAVKVLAGQQRIARLGFRAVGMAAFGLRRMTVSPDGQRKLVLQERERKAIHTDRTILVPGPKKEVECIRTVFRLAASGRTTKEIVSELNRREMKGPAGRMWGRDRIHRILTNNAYAGWNTYGKTTQKLGQTSRAVKPEDWITKPEAFVPIVNQELFDQVQRQLQKRAKHPPKSDADLIRRMKKILERHGVLTHRLVGQRFYTRFGSLMKAYELVGYQPRQKVVTRNETERKMRQLREDLYAKLKNLFPDRVRFLSFRCQKIPPVIEIDGCCRLGVHLCRTVFKGSREIGWLLFLRQCHRDLPALVCTVDPSHSKLLEFYVLPPFKGPAKQKIVRGDIPWVRSGKRLEKIEDLCSVAREIATSSNTRRPCVAVGDVLFREDTWTFSIGARGISLGPVTGALFRALLINANRIVSNQQLMRSVPEGFDASDLSKRIYILRDKLGTENEWRIRTVRGAGYMYITPDTFCTDVGFSPSPALSRFVKTKNSRRENLLRFSKNP
jgi:DNA invertase Pin-like site-specific DNA recombinase/DNA-binding winged helix-turn-helix (wHTH) protein